MKEPNLRSWFVIVLVLLIPTALFAQDGEATDSVDLDTTPGAGAEAAPEGEAGPAAAPASEAAKDEEPEEDPAEEEAAPEAPPEADTAAGTEGTLPSESVGPGGRKLRSDYPGTEESLKSNMETDRVAASSSLGAQPAGSYNLRVRELETKIGDLKEKVYHAKMRVVFLREKLLKGNLAGSRAIIAHHTDLGSSFALRRAVYNLDGAALYSELDDGGGLADKREFEVYNGGIAPGNHNLSILLRYQGDGGIFSYFDGYQFELQTSCDFKAQEGKVAHVHVVAYEDGGVSRKIEERPALRCDIEFTDNLPDKDAESSENAGDDSSS
jgi:hypothetical protein